MEHHQFCETCLGFLLRTLMSLFLSRLLRLRLVKSALMRRSFLLLCNGFSTSVRQTPPCSVIGARPNGHDHARLIVAYANQDAWTDLDKMVQMELVYNVNNNGKTLTIGASHGWVATLKEDGILRLQDDLNPVSSDTYRKRILLPPLETLPHCQTQIITNVSMSSSSPEDDEDCVVAVKFLGPQISFCKPAGKSKPEWTNIKIENPCFYSSRVMFSKKDKVFRIPGSGGHLIGSWDPFEPNGKLESQQSVRFENLPPKLPSILRELMDSCCMSQHLVESPSTGETFLVKQYRKTAETVKGVAKMKTEFLMVYKLDDEGNAVHTEDMGDLVMFLSKSEPFCIPCASFPGFRPNWVYILDFDETTYVDLVDGFPFSSSIETNDVPYYVPPQNYSLETSKTQS